MRDRLKLGPLTESDVHICVDMQRMFAEDTDWYTPWMNRIIPNVMRLVEAHRGQTICTRFIPAQNADEMQGAWRRYYERWDAMTRDRLPAGMLDLVPPLQAVQPQLEVIDKTVFSPWMSSTLDQRLRARGATSVVVTGGETDVCVLATVLGAIDRGYRVVVAVDALCSSADAIHDAAVALYSSRFGQQMESVPTEVVLRNWRASAGS